MPAREEISRALGVSPERIHVTPLGVRAPTAVPASEAVVRAELELGDARVVLSSRRSIPTRTSRSSCGRCRSSTRTSCSCCPGSPTQHERELRALADELGVAERVRLPQWLSEPSLAGLYSLSSAFVLPSLAEGFGLPVLEAMLRGVPVACSNIATLSEVAGDAALLFDPERHEAVAGAISRLLDDRALAERLVARGRERAASFTWARTGECEPRRLPKGDPRSPAASAPSSRDGFPLACAVVPRVLIVRGHLATPWELAPWLELPPRFEVAYLLTGSNRFSTPEGLAQVRVRALRDLLPGGVLGDAGAAVLGDRYLGAADSFASADVVHAEELSFWFAAEAAARKRRHGFRLVQTVWETLPLMSAYRNRHARDVPRAGARRNRPVPARDRARGAGAAPGGRRGVAHRSCARRGSTSTASRRTACGRRADRAHDRLARPAGVGEGSSGRSARARGAAPRDRHAPRRRAASSRVC